MNITSPDNIKASVQPRRAASKQGMAIVAYGTQAPMNWLRSTHNLATMHMRQRLMAQAHAQHWRVGQLLQNINTYTCQHARSDTCHEYMATLASSCSLPSA